MIDETCEKISAPVQLLIQKLSERRTYRPADIIQIIAACDIKEEDLLPWADFDHPAQDSYGRKLVHKSPNFEIMVMSWKPGDISAIHDHGHTTWGAVQVFGPQEHAAFRVEDDQLFALNRTYFKYGQIVGVGHSLIHQMGNYSDKNVLTLHVYGLEEDVNMVTGEARLYLPERGEIQLVNGGVFFNLPSHDVLETIAGPVGDYPTNLRNRVESVNRALVAGRSSADLQPMLDKILDANSRGSLLQHIEQLVNDDHHANDSARWNVLNHELKAAARLVSRESSTSDSFHSYAEMYDHLICQPCLDQFITGYLDFVVDAFEPNWAAKKIFSLGCGTGLVEQHMMQRYSIPRENLYGIDFSASMVQEAQKRIQADQGDILTLDPQLGKWDVAFSGLNVFQYIHSTQLEEAVRRTVEVLQDGGLFLGDFIAPDHIRWYPNVMYSNDRQIISLRTPRLIEQDGKMYQESEIINIDFRSGHMHLNYAGKHKRYLAPLHRVRGYFEKYFSREVRLFDALSLREISGDDDTCQSTRYIVVARK